MTTTPDTLPTAGSLLASPGMVLIADLQDHELDAWVAHAEGLVDLDIQIGGGVTKAIVLNRLDGRLMDMRTGKVWSPSTDPAQGYPIMERERIGTDTYQGPWAAHYSYPVRRPDREGIDPRTKKKYASVSPSHCRMPGATPLIAGMRTRLVRAYGDEVPNTYSKSAAK